MKHKILGFIIIGIIIPFSIHQGMEYFKKPAETSIYSRLLHASDLDNKNCPKMVDEETRLDASMVTGERAVEFYYTLINYSEDELEITDEFKNGLKSDLIKHVKTNDLGIFKEDVTLTYKYKDKNGVPLFSLVVEPKDYK